MQPEPQAIVFTDRSSPDTEWTLPDFFAEGMARSVVGLSLEGVTEETLEPFGQAGLEIDAAELARDLATLAAGGMELLDEALPQLTHILLEELSLRIPELLGPLEPKETIDERRLALYWAGWFSAPEAVNALAREVRRIIAE